MCYIIVHLHLNPSLRQFKVSLFLIVFTMIIKGKVHRFGDDINTDEIISAKYLSFTDLKVLGRHCLQTVREEFASKVSKGDIIVAGKNFGCGSSREHAPLAIKGCGISCVIAESFARIFYRNCLNLGLPILECREARRIKEGSTLEIDLNKGRIEDLTDNGTYQAQAFPTFLLELIKSGGLINWIQKDTIESL